MDKTQLYLYRVKLIPLDVEKLLSDQNHRLGAVIELSPRAGHYLGGAQDISTNYDRRRRVYTWLQQKRKTQNSCNWRPYLRDMRHVGLHANDTTRAVLSWRALEEFSKNSEVLPDHDDRPNLYRVLPVNAVKPRNIRVILYNFRTTPPTRVYADFAAEIFKDERGAVTRKIEHVDIVITLYYRQFIEICGLIVTVCNFDDTLHFGPTLMLQTR